jgi:hypothetical protein
VIWDGMVCLISRRRGKLSHDRMRPHLYIILIIRIALTVRHYDSSIHAAALSSAHDCCAL